MKPIEQWIELVERLGAHWQEKDVGKSWIKTDKCEFWDFEGVDNPFEVCKYANPELKMTQLEKQYFNKESFDQAMEKRAQGAKRVEISLVGGPKWGTSAGKKHCLKSVYIDFEYETASLYIRCSDLIKKFLIDVYFLQEKILKPFHAQHFTLNVYFESVMLRSPFLFIWLEQILDNYGTFAFEGWLKSGNPMVESFLRYYSKNLTKEINYKSLLRARERFEESKVYDLILPYINNYGKGNK